MHTLRHGTEHARGKPRVVLKANPVWVFTQRVCRWVPAPTRLDCTGCMHELKAVYDKPDYIQVVPLSAVKDKTSDLEAGNKVC